MKKIINNISKVTLIFLITIICSMMLIQNSMADPDVVETGPFVYISGIDADFNYTYSSMLYGKYGAGVKIDWIWLIDKTAAGVYVKIDEATDAGAGLFYSYISEDFQSTPVYYHGARMRPVLDYSESSVGHDSTVVIIKVME